MSENVAPMPENQPAADAAPAAPAPGTPEYEQAMAAKYRAGGQTPTVDPKPENGHDKYYDAKTGAYNWEAHNKEEAWKAEQRIKQAAPDAMSFINPPKEEPMDVGAGLREFSTIVGRGDKTAAAELAGRLMQAGVPQEALQMQVEAVQARQASKAREMVEYAGGDAALQDMKQYLAALPAADRQAFAKALQGPQWNMAMDSIKMRMGGPRPALSMDGGGGSNADAVPFASKAEQVAALRDPRYRSHTDPTYRNQVRARIAAGMKRT